MFSGVGVDWTVGLSGRKREGELHVFYKSGCGGWWSGQIFTTIKQRKEKKTKKESGHFASNPQNRFETFQKLSNPS